MSNYTRDKVNVIYVGVVDCHATARYSKKQRKNCQKFLESTLRYTNNALKDVLDLLNLELLKARKLLIWTMTS